MQQHSFTVQLFTLLTTKHNCVDKMENKTITMEYNYYPGYYLSSSTMLLTWSGKEVVKDVWEVTRCGKEEVCLTGLKGPLEVESSRGKLNRLAAKTGQDKMGNEDPGWNMRFEVLCEDCETGEHCNIVNMVQGEEGEEERGMMMADRRGRVSFGVNYGTSYGDWFDWTIKIQNRQGILQKHASNPRGRFLPDCGRICGNQLL